MSIYIYTYMPIFRKRTDLFSWPKMLTCVVFRHHRPCGAFTSGHPAASEEIVLLWECLRRVPSRNHLEIELI